MKRNVEAVVIDAESVPQAIIGRRNQRLDRVLDRHQAHVLEEDTHSGGERDPSEDLHVGLDLFHRRRAPDVSKIELVDVGHGSGIGRIVTLQ